MIGKYSWFDLISQEMDHHDDSWQQLERSTLSDEDLNATRDSGLWGRWEQKDKDFQFTLWTKNRVYFPVVYDGAEWVASAPRDPCDEKVEHVGGGGA